ncbi:hypothetical protein MLD38_040194 [Melastoma candidum]|uniref:Uncharacterized protein n=1 Tax=Melastoma candidum TaxID=119954 RepID=A0ACB9L5A6_9MYRT|nr:hypothetical protein MLD38_040194 [Melastoma candidum]
MALPMEFWGVEVKAGQPLKVNTNGKLLHLSQASLGESKSGKGSGFVPLHVKFGDQKLVLGTLSPETIPQLSFDLVFEKEFELSHNWKNGSVYFCGYTSVVQDDEEFSEDEFDSEEEEEAKLPVTASENGLVKSKAETAVAKPNQQPKPKVSIVEPMKTDEDDSDEDDDEDGSSDEGDDSEDESDDDEDDSDEDEEETPKKVESGKKRPAEPAAKTPTPSKKAKASTPQKTDGKKGAHTATPHPAKQAGKTKEQAQKSAGQFQCNTCSKTFNSDNALKSHSAAKHSAK